MARLGVLGGTFDPIHNGHLGAAHHVARMCGLDGVMFVPAGDPYQKGRTFASAEDRVAMTTLAIQSEPTFSLSRVDVDRGGPTYTVDTLADLSLTHPHDELVVILGADAFAGLDTWREPERIWARAVIAVMARPGVEVRNPGVPLDRLIVVEGEEFDVSSTQIRERVSRNESIQDLVPAVVAEYIERKQLYRA